MGLFRSLIQKFWNRASPEKIDTKTCEGILIKPDGTWVIQKKPNQTPPYNPPNIIKMPPIPGKDYNFYDTNTDLELLNFPPSYFPNGKELFTKLEACIDLDVISSCTHKQTQNNVYILSIEVPCGENQGESISRFNQFVKAMEKTYKLKPIQQERINSTTSSEKYFLVVFEYDPRQFTFQKLNGDENNE